METEDQSLGVLRKIATDFTSQNNRATEWPLFAVQQKVRQWGVDCDYQDGSAWVHSKMEDGLVAASDEELDLISEELDPDRNWSSEAKWSVFDERGNEEEFDFVLLGYCDRWEFVTACFTERACQEFIDSQSHNLGETRIYAYSAHRNREWKTISKVLKGLVGV